MIKKFRRGRDEKKETTPKFRVHFKSERVRSAWDMPPLNKKIKVNTDRQLVQQKKWELASQFAATFAVALIAAKKYDQYKGWQRSALIKHVINNAINGTYPHFEIDYSQVVLSEGTLNVYPNLVPSLSATGKLTIKLISYVLPGQSRLPTEYFCVCIILIQIWSGVLNGRLLNLR
jgi:hypothetical protein